MSRFGDYEYEEEFPGQAALYRANLLRAMRGRRGRQFLIDLREALMALPEHKLIEGALCTVGADRRKAELEAAAPTSYAPLALEEYVERDGEGVCANGAYLWHQKVRAGMDPQEAFAELPTIFGFDCDGAGETAELVAQQADVAGMIAWQVAYRNDETYECKTPQERHALFIEWIDRELAGSVA
jgi:hypothetical protein